MTHDTPTPAALVKSNINITTGATEPSQHQRGPTPAGSRLDVRTREGCVDITSLYTLHSPTHCRRGKRESDRTRGLRGRLFPIPLSEEVSA
ncbi:hypothetical protein E2C01_054980 [Portunus trituberculatus]|uniref:Uncharacterized protein n=1 Tax=Portunus trituberculatus TaxID=210409 RepID=A0A5B7GL32_PORTR|nr:hypothetical protein [Portunus trituberculatus]